MSKHTKGPWSTWEDKDSEGDMEIFILEEEGSRELVCKLLPSQGGDNEDRANARLIATAPEMLAMLKRLATISTMDLKWDEELQDIIAKAEGRE